MKVEQRKITDIKPYPNNPRINDQAVDAVAASIREFGFRQPIVVDEQGVIVVGNTRFKAAVKLGLKTVPVHVITGLSPAQLKAYRIADNQTASLADWNHDLLTQELMELQTLDFDVDLLGFSAEELSQLLDDGDGQSFLTDPDDIPEPPDEAVTQPGDLWVLGNHRLLCGDSSKAEDVDRLLDSQPIHLCNTDPPYNVKVEPRSNNAIASGLSSFQGTKHHQKFDVERHPEKAHATHRKMRAKDRPLENDFVSDEEFDRLLKAWFGNLARVLLPGRGFYIWGGYANCSNYPKPLKECGLYFSQSIIWDKQHPVLTRKDFMGAHEWCFYGWREGAAHQYYGPNNATDLWAIKKVNPQSMVHLTEKPVALAEQAIEYSSKRGENVLDPNRRRADRSSGLLDGARHVVLRCYRPAMGAVYGQEGETRREETRNETPHQEEGIRVNLRTRLERLELALGAVGRCPKCSDRPEVVYRALRQDSPDAVPRPERTESDVHEACPDCGSTVAVREIVEVVIESQEDLARVAEMYALE